jgi:hypothetical protein
LTALGHGEVEATKEYHVHPRVAALARELEPCRFEPYIFGLWDSFERLGIIWVKEGFAEVADLLLSSRAGQG